VEEQFESKFQVIVQKLQIPMREDLVVETDLVVATLVVVDHLVAIQVVEDHVVVLETDLVLKVVMILEIEEESLKVAEELSTVEEEIVN
jgi:hypothetical protein